MLTGGLPLFFVGNNKFLLSERFCGRGVRVTTLTTLNTDYIISQKVVFQYTHLFTHLFKNTISHPSQLSRHAHLSNIVRREHKFGFIAIIIKPSTVSATV